MLPVLGTLALVLGISGLLLSIVMFTLRFNPVTRLSLALSGVSTPAKVISVVGLNHNPQSSINIYDLELELLGDFAGKRVKKRVVGPRGGVFGGQTIAVIVHPDKPTRFRVDWKSAKSEIDKLASGDISSLLAGGGNARVILGGPTQTATSPEDRIAKLERLHSLHQSGALTDAEFESMKRKVLD